MAPRIPKGPNNQAGAPVPGTQQTAIRRAGGGGFNQNMPLQPQQQKALRGGYQRRALTPSPLPTTPMPAGGARPAAPRPSVIPAPSARTAGYDLATQIPHEDLMRLNRSMGYSADQFPTPAVAETITPQLGRAQAIPGGFDPDQGAVMVKGKKKKNSEVLTMAPTGGDLWVGGTWTSSGGSVKVKYSDTEKGQYTTYNEDVGGYVTGEDDAKIKALAEAEEAVIGGGEEAEAGAEEPGEGKWQGGVSPYVWATMTDEEKEQYLEATGQVMGLDGTPAPGPTGSDEVIAAKAAAEDAKSVIDEEAIGYDTESMEKITTLFDEQASKAYQMGVGPMNRMYAMMGMTGSGAHIAANNALAAQVYDTLSKQYSSLYQADLEAQERDWQEKVTNLQSLVDAYAKVSVMTREDAFLMIEQFGAINTTITQPLLSWAAEQGENIDGELLLKMIGKGLEILNSYPAGSKEGLAATMDYLSGATSSLAAV